jgi:hypothetical protein
MSKKPLDNFLLLIGLWAIMNCAVAAVADYDALVQQGKSQLQAGSATAALSSQRMSQRLMRWAYLLRMDITLSKGI